MTRLTTRFAPSPTGRLHLGHAYSAILAHDAARAAGGRFLLRIEDIDLTRRREDVIAAIFEDLSWLGLDWERPVRLQSEHFADYAALLDRLRSMDLVYRCFRTRRDLMEAALSAPHGPEEAVRPGRHAPDDEARRLAAGEAFAWRLDAVRALARAGACSFLEEGAGQAGEAGRIALRPDLIGDVVLARKDAPASYHLAVVHDDALQGVTHVVRGADLFEATHLHILLQRLLGLPTPVYRHHRLLVGEDGRRYAKRDGAVQLAQLRAAGASPADIRRRIGVPA